MSLAAGWRDLLDRARVELIDPPALGAIEADFTALHEAIAAGDPAADGKALEIVKRLYQPPPPPAPAPKPAAKADGGGQQAGLAGPAKPAAKSGQ